MRASPVRLVVLVATLLALPPASPLAAQVAPPAPAPQDTVRRAPPRDSAHALEGLRVRAAYAPRVVGSASAVSLRPDSMPLALPAPTLGDALRRLPFLYTRTNSRGETEISVRGSESRQAAVFFEGVPLTLTWDARADASIVPMAGVARLDYVRGLSSLLAGPNAIGGVVTARMWEDHDPTRPPERVLRTDLQVDQFGGVRTALTAGGALMHTPSATLAAKVGGGWRTLPGLALPARVTDPGGDGRLRLNTDARSTDLFAAARYEHAQGRYLSALVTAQEGERGVAPELHVNAPRLWRNPEVRRQVLSLSAGTGALRSRLGVGDVEVAYGVNQGFVQIDSYTDRQYRTLAGVELGDDHTASLRVAFDQQLGPRAALRGAFTRADIRYLETLGSAAPVRYRQRLESSAAEVDLFPTRLVTVSGGVALDAATTEEAGGRPPLGRTDGLGWRTGVTWVLPAQGVRLHASTSERRRFPSLRELYSGALNRFAPNPALRPETSRQLEAGATVVRGAFDGQVALFGSRIRDAVVRTTLADRRFFRVNRDRLDSHGVELTGGLALGATTVRGDLVVQRARLADQTIADPALREPEDVPSRYGSVLATWALAPGVELQGRLRAVGATRCTNPDSGRLDTQRGAATTDVGVERRWRSRAGIALRALLQLENVTDRALYDRCGLPQAGRTFRLGFTVG
jgi:iron complex outermembrane receptor protein